MFKILIAMGTRPEAIKLWPVIEELKRHKKKVTTIILLTSQHKKLLNQALRLYRNIKLDFNLDIMISDQSLFFITSKTLDLLQSHFAKINPALVMVQGDTTTAFAAALSAFYLKIPVAHVEAGLRTQDKYNPFPEEMNRRLIDSIAYIHFAPTSTSRDNLIREGMDKRKIFVTGNTAIDSLILVRDRAEKEKLNMMGGLLDRLDGNKRLILVTAHRRESFGPPFVNICKAIRAIAQNNSDVEIVYPVHLNPNVRRAASSFLNGPERVHLLEPLDYVSFVSLMNRAYIILTDSGGIQEEAPSLGKPVLVMRHVTERIEALKAGTIKLVGTDTEKIVRGVQRLLDDENEYRMMASRRNPYGDGQAAKRIVSILLKTCDENAHRI